MNTVAKTEQRSAVATVGDALEKMKPQLQAVLPKHITPERMVRVAMVAIQNTPKLLECDRQSLYLAILRSAQLGLEPDGILGQAYLIPYGKQVQFIPGYKGLIDLARRSGDVSNIIAKEVCKNDVFKIEWHKTPPFEHVQKIDGDRGDVIGFWALANFKDGGYHFDFLTIEEVQKIRDGSAGWQTAKKFNSTAKSPWEQHFIEMGKKTAIRRIAKFLPMSVQKAAAFEALQDTGHKVSFNDGDLVIDELPDDGKTIDGEGSPVPETKKLDQFANSPAPEASVKGDDSPGQQPVSTGSAAPAGEELPNFVKGRSKTKPTAKPYTLAGTDYDLATVDGVRSAADALLSIIDKVLPEVRGDTYRDFGGAEVVAALYGHNLTEYAAKFSEKVAA